MGLGEGLIALFLYGVLYALFGTFANAIVRADAARRESQALLAQLRETHSQLQAYALRVEELAVVEERNRLAREMHDTLGHRLTVAAVQLEGAQRLCPTNPQRAARIVGTVRELVREALRELRGTVAALRTPIEADLRLRDSVRRLANHFEGATGLTVNLMLPEEMPDLPDIYRLALYRTAQEALTNVQRHAQAQDVWLQLTWHDEAITLMISDNGVGIPAGADQTGFGLRGMVERAAQLGGELHIDPRTGGGSQIRFSLPLIQEEVDGRADSHPTGR
jgi:signal transduction histidine kinase